MKRTILVAFMLLTMLISLATAKPSQSALVPYPNNIEMIGGEPFRLSSNTAVYATDGLDVAVQMLQDAVAQYCGVEVKVATSERDANIRLIIDPTIQEPERYLLTVGGDGIAVRGATVRAVIYGVVTLQQVLMGDVSNSLAHCVAPIKVDDQPRYPFRAIMLDPARHFLPVEDVCFFIDQMVLYKYNTLQLHLTDDQGWRIDLKSHPEMTAAEREGEFYTHDDIKQIIAYAAARGIDVLPEVDIPGHTYALLKVHPEYACDFEGAASNGVNNSMVCACSSEFYAFIDDVISELAELFPYEYIHLGGDEAVLEKNWKLCSRCSALKEEMQYAEEAQLMGYFFDKVLPTVRRCGKKPILWCELDNMWPPVSKYLFEYPQDVTLVTWRNALTPSCIEFTSKSGHSLIMAPGEHCYLDYPQYVGDLPEHNNWGMPITTLEQTYRLDPSYQLDSQADRHIRGVMATLWGEAINDINRACYMAFPRAIAVAEAGWTDMRYRNYDSFVNRLYPNLTHLMRRGVPFRVPFEAAKPPRE